MQLLVNQLVQHETETLLPSTQYEVWSPYDAAGAAAILTQMLEKATL